MVEIELRSKGNVPEKWSSSQVQFLSVFGSFVIIRTYNLLALIA